MGIEQDYPNRRFVIFDFSEISKIDFNQVLEDSPSTVRRSIDQTKTFVKYELPQPSSVSSLASKSQEYTYDDMDVILQTSEWTEDYPVGPGGL